MHKMTTEFIQPDPFTCVPTAFAYLLHKEKNLNFQNTLEYLVSECYKHFSDIPENGMEFEQMAAVANELGFNCSCSTTKPSTRSYITGVTKLPKGSFEYNDFIREAITENSLKIEEKYFVYPFGHAVVVSEQDEEQAIIFDSLLGIETDILQTELAQYLENPVTYLSLIE